MIYSNICEGIFLSRPNRFIAHVEIGDRTEICHVKNTGRCKELLVSGARVYLDESDNPGRTTKYDLVAVWKGERLINMDSQAPNRVFLEYLGSGRYIDNITLIKPEARYGSSRFDFYCEATRFPGTRSKSVDFANGWGSYVEAGKRKIFIEVKGVTLEENGVALFPDAPTERGVKHLNELARCIGEGYEAQVVFVIQINNVRYFAPNNATHPAFGEALIATEAAGVKVVALDCKVSPDSMVIGESVPVRLI